MLTTKRCTERTGMACKGRMVTMREALAMGLQARCVNDDETAPDLWILITEDRVVPVAPFCSHGKVAV